MSGVVKLLTNLANQKYESQLLFILCKNRIQRKTYILKIIPYPTDLLNKTYLAIALAKASFIIVNHNIHKIKCKK